MIIRIAAAVDDNDGNDIYDNKCNDGDSNDYDNGSNNEDDEINDNNMIVIILASMMMLMVKITTTPMMIRTIITIITIMIMMIRSKVTIKDNDYEDIQNKSSNNDNRP